MQPYLGTGQITDGHITETAISAAAIFLLPIIQRLWLRLRGNLPRYIACFRSKERHKERHMAWTFLLLWFLGAAGAITCTGLFFAARDHKLDLKASGVLRCFAAWHGGLVLAMNSFESYEIVWTFTVALDGTRTRVLFWSRLVLQGVIVSLTIWKPVPVALAILQASGLLTHANAAIALSILWWRLKKAEKCTTSIIGRREGCATSSRIKPLAIASMIASLLSLGALLASWPSEYPTGHLGMQSLLCVCYIGSLLPGSADPAQKSDTHGRPKSSLDFYCAGDEEMIDWQTNSDSSISDSENTRIEVLGMHFPGAGTSFCRVDEKAQEHMETLHKFYLEVGYAPSGVQISERGNVLDVGTGTGAWAIDLARRYHNAKVLGTDLAPIQPMDVPGNVKFLIHDANDEWEWEGKFDLVHCRDLNGGMAKWDRVFGDMFRSLKPGGIVKMCGIYSNLEDHAKVPGHTRTWPQMLHSLEAKTSMAFGEPSLFKRGLERAGFRITCDERIPLSEDMQRKWQGALGNAFWEKNKGIYAWMLVLLHEVPVLEQQDHMEHFEKSMRGQNNMGITVYRIVGQKTAEDKPSKEFMA